MDGTNCAFFGSTTDIFFVVACPWSFRAFSALICARVLIPDVITGVVVFVVVRDLLIAPLILVLLLFLFMVVVVVVFIVVVGFLVAPAVAAAAAATFFAFSALICDKVLMAFVFDEEVPVLELELERVVYIHIHKK